MMKHAAPPSSPRKRSRQAVAVKRGRRKKYDYRTVRALVHTLKLGKTTAYFEKCREYPGQLPKSPREAFGLKWRGWRDFLGKSYTAPRRRRSDAGKSRPYYRSRATTSTLVTIKGLLHTPSRRQSALHEALKKGPRRTPVKRHQRAGKSRKNSVRFWAIRGRISKGNYKSLLETDPRGVPSLRERTTISISQPAASAQAKSISTVMLSSPEFARCSSPGLVGLFVFRLDFVVAIS
jgi:hypothetical protein